MSDVFRGFKGVGSSVVLYQQGFVAPQVDTESFLAFAGGEDGDAGHDQVRRIRLAKAPNYIDVIADFELKLVVVSLDFLSEWMVLTWALFLASFFPLTRILLS